MLSHESVRCVTRTSETGHKCPYLSEKYLQVDRADRNQRLDLIDKGADARSSVYSFNAEVPDIAVYSGKVRVKDDRRAIEIGQGQELSLTGTPPRPRKFDREIGRA